MGVREGWGERKKGEEEKGRKGGKAGLWKREKKGWGEKKKGELKWERWERKDTRERMVRSEGEISIGKEKKKR